MQVENPSVRFEAGSFRDPDTRVFHYNDSVYRCLSARALADWQRLAATDFFARFAADRRIVATRRITDAEALPPLDERWAAVLEHERLPFVSYPYEWSFGMLKDAALLQLDLTRAALDEDMTLKDATAFNVQWLGAQPTFIDVGSFTAYAAGDPWAGYRQFCESFFYPLLLQAYRGVPFHPWLRGSLEGITAAQCSALLSGRDLLRRGVLAHVHLQARAQARYDDAPGNVRQELRAAGFGAELIKHNIDRLRRTVERLRWDAGRSTWSEYQCEHSYDDADLQRKQAFVERVLASRRWPLVWDIGCNTGNYSRLAAAHAEYVLALDADHLVIERLYQALKADGPGKRPAAAGRPGRSVAGPGLARTRAPAAGRPRPPGAHPVPGADSPPGDRPQHPAGRLRGLAGAVSAARSCWSSSDLRIRWSSGCCATARTRNSTIPPWRSERCARTALRRRHARNAGFRHPHAVPLPAADAMKRSRAVSTAGVPGWARAADALTVVLALMALYVIAFGGIRIGDVFSMSTPWRALAGLTVTCVLRHYLVRSPPLHERMLRARVWAWLPAAAPWLRLAAERVTSRLRSWTSRPRHEEPETDSERRLQVLHILGLWCLAVVQPVFDVVGRSPEFFIAHDAQPARPAGSGGSPVPRRPGPLPGSLVRLAGLAGGPRWRRRDGGRGHRRPGRGGSCSRRSSRCRARTAAIWWRWLRLGGAGAAVAYRRYAPARLFATFLTPAALIVPARVPAGTPNVSRLLAAANEVEALDGVTFDCNAAGRRRRIRPVPACTALLDRDGNIDRATFPHFAALADDATWFRNATRRRRG